MLYILPASEALPQDNIIFPEAVNHVPELWPLFVHLAEDTRCPACEGSGRDANHHPCPACHGRGEVQ